ncbi:nuclear transport factor 2 family protein [Micromonospora sp. WMMC241]|uniref:nuclear transport factor 2 family protein n=1 Tax=Micromonospora sp. WMMC241 TaxID=3015159 RepID=UPI0022B6751C|nr:nuclear transport factor 2 family protein [Micromonospora sp. WMMC241]MCZ7438827.1 nuclear transport factor 2 family protein [Micromonospora sp. WMMC241]
MSDIQEATAADLRRAAQDVFRRHLELLAAGRVREWVELFAENGTIEHPFAPAGVRSRASGKSDLFDYIQHFPEVFSVTFTEPQFHETTDPELVIAEFRAEGIAIPTGKRYDQQYINVVRTKDGKIVHYVDFWNPLVALSAMGEDLTTAFFD